LGLSISAGGSVTISSGGIVDLVSGSMIAGSLTLVSGTTLQVSSGAALGNYSVSKGVTAVILSGGPSPQARSRRAVSSSWSPGASSAAAR
jgi:hypothetical protein